MRILCSISVLAVCLSAFREHSDGGPSDLPRRFVGATMPSEDLAIGAAQSGVIAHLAVRVGDRVKKGELLFRLNTKRDELEVARLRVVAESDAEVREAQARLVQAEREEKRYLDLHDREIAGDSALDERRREAEVARIKLERAKVEHKVADLRYQEAAARLAERIVHSPIDGYVAELHHRRGEAVEELQPVVKLVSLDPMWVEFDCPVVDGRLFAKGAKVEVQRADDAASAAAVVVFASEVADAASQTFKVRLELRGRPSWKAGVKVFVIVAK